MTNQVGPGYPAAGGPPEPAPPTPRTSRLAVASLILGVLFPIVGFILGIIALFRISASKGAMKGRGLAAAGVVLGAVIPCVTLLLLRDARDQARAVVCRSNLKQIGLAIAMYQADYNEQMPPNMEPLVVENYLMIGVGKYDVEHNTPAPGDTVFSCPSRYGKLMSGDLDGTGSYYYAQLKDPEQMRQPAAIPIMWEKVKSHRMGVNVLFADMHVIGEPLEVLRGQIEQNAGLYVKPPLLPEAEKK